MNFARLIIGLFGIQVIATTAEAENPKIVIPPSEITKILGLTNTLRRSVNPPPTNLIEVKWDQELADDLAAYVMNNPRGILFKNDTQLPPYNTDLVYHKHNWRMHNLMLYPEFAKYTNTSGYLTHDTCINKKNAVYKIFLFRGAQAKCFDYSSCNPYNFTNYNDCVKPSLRNVLNQKNGEEVCHYSQEYYMHLLFQMNSMSCILMDYPGPFTPTNQANSFVCYYRSLQPLNFASDILYPTGPRASDCPPTYHAYKGLCTNNPQNGRLLKDTKEQEEEEQVPGSYLRGTSKNSNRISFN